MSYKYIDFDNETPDAILAQDNHCKPFNVQIPISRNWNDAKQKILVVLQHVDSDDLKSKRLLSSTAGTVLNEVFKLAEKYVKPFGYKSYELAVINFNYFKTYHLEGTSELSREALKHSARRVLKLIDKIKPDKVLVIGDQAAESLLPGTALLRELRGWPHKKKGYDCKFFTTVDFTKAYSKKLDEDGENDEQQDKVMDYANLLGYISRNVGHCLHGDVVYKVDVKAKPVLIDTMPKFKKLLRALDKAKNFAYDTETTGLERVVNTILTMQFAFDSKRGYIVPLHHKDSPFSKKEKRKIERYMQKFWSKYEDPLCTDYDRYYIGQNLKFDNTVTRQQFGVYTIKRRLWDLMAGEYGLDENLKGLKNYKMGDDYGIYSLVQIEAHYGCRLHADGDFKKDDARTIEHRDLDTPGMLEYMALDVQIPYAIHKKQIERARHIKHLHGTYEQDFKRFVLTQMNNMIHIQSIMEHRGTHCDIEWLHKLKEKDGPLEQARKDTKKQLYGMKSVIEANRRISKKAGRPEGNLFGKKEAVWELKLSKPAHKLMLFINVLKLEPLGYGRDGETPSVDKFFQERYKEVPEVKLFTELSSVDKLTGTYVNGFLRKLRTSRDFKKDHKLRPSFGFTDTVTGRSNSFDPNLQQIPTRGVYAKHIKRIFASSIGRLKLKMDYSAHEVRVWSIISKDKKLGSLFDLGRQYRQKYRRKPTEELEQMIATQGDVHIQNVSFFFGMKLTDIKMVPVLGKDGKPELDKNGKPKRAFPKDIKDKRDAVKSIVFGAIYGRGASSIAKQTNKDKKYIEDLLKKFFPRFPKASKWLESAKAMPLTHNYVYSPIGRRRNLYAHLFGLDNFRAMVERRGCNAPVQGLAADMGHTAAYLFGIYYEKFLQDYVKLKDPDMDIGNIEVMVHDSIESDFPYELYLVALQILQWCATIGCMEYYYRHYGIKFTTALEVEFEMGADSSTMEKWDWSEDNLKANIKKALEIQKSRHPKLDAKKALAKVYDIRSNKKVMKYLDKNFPVLGDLPQHLMAA